MSKKPASAEKPVGPLRWLVSGSIRHSAHLVLAHGAGAGMDSPFLERIAGLIAARGVTVHRFEFPYMVERSAGLSHRPAPRAETLIGAYRGALAEVRTKIGNGQRLFAGGKSMGGRIACLVAGLEPTLAGVVVLGFPLTPPRRPDSSRAGVLTALSRPALIVQGTRDPFGGRAAFDAIDLPATVETTWIEDGDHDLKPRRASGMTHEEALLAAAAAVARFCRRDG